MRTYLSFLLILLVGLATWNCSGSKPSVSKPEPVEQAKDTAPALTDLELIEKYFKNELENYKEAHSSAYALLPPATQIDPSSFPETIEFNFERLEFKSMRRALYHVELRNESSLEANYYVKLNYENQQWKVYAIYLFDLQEIMRDIYNNTYKNKSKVDLLNTFKEERNKRMSQNGIKDTLQYNKRFGDFSAYSLKAKKVELLAQSDSDLIAYFTANTSQFESLLERIKNETYVEFSHPDYGTELKALLIDNFEHVDNMYYFSLIGGFGEGLQGQDIGFLKVNAPQQITPRNLMSGLEPYLLTIPINDSWYLYKQK